MSTDYLAAQVPAQAPTPPAERITPPQRSAPAAKPWYRQPRVWGEMALIMLVFAVTAMFVVTLSSLGTAHGQTGAANASLGKANTSLSILHSQYAASQATDRSLAAQLAAQQGQALVGSWTSPSNGKTYTWTVNADHTMTLAFPGTSTSTGYWAIAAPGRIVMDYQGMGPALPASQGGGYSDMGFAPTFTINGDTLTLTYGSGSSASTETYTRSSGTGVLGGG